MYDEVVVVSIFYPHVGICHIVDKELVLCVYVDVCVCVVSFDDESDVDVGAFAYDFCCIFVVLHYDGEVFFFFVFPRCGIYVFGLSFSEESVYF